MLEYVELPALEPLFFQGDSGDDLYIVFTGSVGMYIHNPQALQAFKREHKRTGGVTATSVPELASM